MQIKVYASNARPTTTGVEAGVDVDVSVTLPDGREIDGEVTLLPAEDGRPRFEAWGSPENWMSWGLLRDLRAMTDGNAGALRDILSDIASAAGDAAGAPG